LARRGDLERPDREPESFRHFDAALLPRFHQQHGELLTTDPRGEIDAPCALPQYFADATNGIVAGVVAKTVIQILEVVDVDHQQAKRMIKAHGTANLALELPFEPAAIGQAGQVVGKSGLFAYIEVRLKFEQCARPCEQEVQVGGIGDIAQRPDFRRAAQVFRTAARSGLHDYWDEPCNRVGPYALGQFVAVHPGHHNVCNDQVRLIRLDRGKCLVTVSCGGYAVTGKAQSGFEQAEFIGIIVDDENVSF